MEPSALETQMRELIAETKFRCVDLRFIDGRWWVVAPYGTIMMVVAGTGSETVAEAIGRALAKWRARNPQQDFYHG